MVENFNFKGGYGVYKLRPQLGNFKMENNLQPCPVMEESMHHCILDLPTLKCNVIYGRFLKGHFFSEDSHACDKKNRTQNRNFQLFCTEKS